MTPKVQKCIINSFRQYYLIVLQHAAFPNCTIISSMNMMFVERSCKIFFFFFLFEQLYLIFRIYLNFVTPMFRAIGSILLSLKCRKEIMPVVFYRHYS